MRVFVAVLVGVRVLVFVGVKVGVAVGQSGIPETGEMPPLYVAQSVFSRSIATSIESPEVPSTNIVMAPILEKFENPLTAVMLLNGMAKDVGVETT